MLYKRPMFKMGGSPTGIESLTPRVKAQNGFNSFLNNFILGDKFKTNTVPVSETNQKVGIEEIYKDKKPRFEFNQTNEPLSIEDFYKVESDRRKKKAENIFEFMKAKPIKVDGKTYDITGGEEIISSPNFDNFASAREKMTKIPNYNEIAAKVVPNKGDKGDVDKSKDTQPGGEVVEDSFDSEYDKQMKRLEKYLGTDNRETKGRLALALSDAIGTEGTIADKASALNKSLLGIMGQSKKDKRELAKIAFAATTELEKAKIAAGKKGFSERRFDEYANLASKKDRTKSEESRFQILKDALGIKTGLTGPSATAAGKIANEVNDTIVDLQTASEDEKSELQSKIIAGINQLLLIQGVTKDNVSGIVGFDVSSYFANGGRVNKAMGGGAS